MLLTDVRALVPLVNHHLPRIIVTLPSPPRASLLFYAGWIVAKLLAQNSTLLTYSSNWQDVTLEPRNARQNAIKRLEVLANFFTIIANGDVPPNSQNCQDLMHHIFGCFVKRPHWPYKTLPLGYSICNSTYHRQPRQSTTLCTVPPVFQCSHWSQWWHQSHHQHFSSGGGTIHHEQGEQG